MCMLHCLACEMLKTSEISLKYYRDFDPLKRIGIHELDRRAIETLKVDRKTFYELIYRKGQLDSIIINNPYGSSQPWLKYAAMGSEG